MHQFNRKYDLRASQELIKFHLLLAQGCKKVNVNSSERIFLRAPGCTDPELPKELIPWDLFHAIQRSMPSGSSAAMMQWNPDIAPAGS